MNALILVGLQNDFLPGGARAVPQGDAIIPLANQLQRCFKLVVASQDWHPANHQSFAANHPGRKPGDVLKLRKAPQLLWPIHCVQNTRGAELAPALSLTRVNKIIKKGTDPDIGSYSAFFDDDKARPTGLHTYLREKNVTQVYIMGLATDYGVKFTALDAVQLGFQTFLIKDGCRGMNLHAGDVERALAEMQQAGVIVVLSGTLLEPPRSV